VIKGAGIWEVQTPLNVEELKTLKKKERARVMSQIERQFIGEALRRNQGNVSRSAQDVGMDRRQLQNLIKKYGILVEDYRGKR
jgi:transcriptional regulator with GAF, ATPase, and Fis domain